MPARAAMPATGATLIGMPVPRLVHSDPTARVTEARSRRQLYLERSSLIDMSERPVIVPSRPSSGDQTQIVRRPVRKASGRRWIFIFGGAAATAMLLATWLGFSQRARHAGIEQRAPLASKEERPSTSPVPTTTVVSPSRPIVAPMADDGLTFAMLTAESPPRAVLASGRHSKKAPGRLDSPSRLAAHRKPARAVQPQRASTKPSTLAWVDPFVDR